MRKTLILLSIMMLMSGCAHNEVTITSESEHPPIIETVEKPVELGYLIVEGVPTEPDEPDEPEPVLSEEVDEPVEVEVEVEVEEPELPEETQDVEVQSEPEEINGWVSLGEFTLTAYCACEKCCGKSDGITATGTVATAGRTIAVDPTVIPYGSSVQIYGNTYIAEDCGGAIKENKIDVFFDTHEEALEFGRRSAEVFIWRG